MIFVNRTASLIFLALIVIAGCARYNPHKLPFISDNFKQQGDVSISAKRLKSKEAKHYLGGRINTKDYAAIQLNVYNSSDRCYVIDQTTINLQLQPTEEVAKRMYHSTVGRVLGWGILGTAFFPFLILAGYYGVKSSETNKKIDRDFADRCLGAGDQMLIDPNTSVTKVVFVASKDIGNDFVVGLKDLLNQQIIRFRFVGLY